MGKTSAPTFLDKTSFFSESQIRKLNSMIKSQVNLFFSKSIQPKLPKENSTTVVDTWTDYVVSEYDYKFNKNFFIFAVIDIKKNGSAMLFELNETPTRLNWIGYTSTEMDDAASKYISITVDNNKIICDISSIPQNNEVLLNIWGEYE